MLVKYPAKKLYCRDIGALHYRIVLQDSHNSTQSHLTSLSESFCPQHISNVYVSLDKINANRILFIL